MYSIQEQVIASYETIKQMLADRGIDVSSLEALGASSLEQLCTTQNIFTVEVNDALCIVYYLTKMKIAEFKSAMFGKTKDIEEEDVKRVQGKMHIFVFKDEINAQNKKNVSEYFKQHQVFHIMDLMFNVSKHSLVPKHEVMRDEEDIRDLFSRYNIKGRAQMPAIHQGEPMAKYLGLVPGDIVRITRPSQTCGNYFYYRVCVA